MIHAKQIANDVASHGVGCAENSQRKSRGEYANADETGYEKERAAFERARWEGPSLTGKKMKTKKAKPIPMAVNSAKKEREKRAHAT